MVSEHWSDQDNDAIVALYFQMLGDELAGRDYNKAANNRSLQQVLGRSKGSIEFKNCNISAALMGFGLSYVRGYQPRFNFQMSLAEAISRWLARNPAFNSATVPSIPQAFAEPPALFLGLPPTLQNSPPPAEFSQLQAIARKFDVAGRDARNRALGKAVRNGCFTMSGPNSRLTDAWTWPPRSGGFRRRMVTALAMTSRVLIQMVRGA